MRISLVVGSDTDELKLLLELLMVLCCCCRRLDRRTCRPCRRKMCLSGTRRCHCRTRA